MFFGGILGNFRDIWGMSEEVRGVSGGVRRVSRVIGVSPDGHH